MLHFLLATATLVRAAQMCTDPLDGVANDASLSVAISTIDAPVYWQPRFAGEAGDGNVVFVISNFGTLYMSEDDGKKWNNLSKDRTRFPSLAANGTTWAKHVFFGATAASHFYVIGYSVDSATNKHLPSQWTTRDKGKTWKVIADPYDFSWIETHPKLADVAIGFSWSVAGARQTFLTTNLGDSWANVGGDGANTTFATFFACENTACAQMSSIMFQRSNGDWDDCKSGRCVLMKRSFDASKTSANALSNDLLAVAHASDGFTETHWPWYDNTARKWMFSSQRQLTNSSNDLNEQKLQYSSDGGHTWTLALFPFGFERHHFRFVTTETDVVLAGVRPADSSEDYGDLYVSAPDEPGRFVQIQRYVLFSKPWDWEETMFAGSLEIERSGEVDGTFVANVYRFRNGELDKSCVQTKITHNYGVTWSFLRNKACTGGDCSLHLRFDSFPTPYAPTDAVGVWVAQGNLGECLSAGTTAGDTATWYSDDAGATWLQMSSEKVIYEVSNHGALVAGAPTERPSNELMYTINHGVSFGTCQWNNYNISVKNILTRSFNARSFILEGYTDNNINGVLAHFDFSDVQERDCAATDYELWPSASQCLLGQHRQWLRRKALAQCHNPTEHEAVAMETPCACTKDDWECDFCYTFNATVENCVVLPTQICRAYTATPGAICNDPTYTKATYRVSDGFKLQPNNRCQGGVQHGHEETCVNKLVTPVSGGGGMVIAIAIVASAIIIAATIGVGVWYYLKKKRSATTQYGALTTDDTSLLMDE